MRVTRCEFVHNLPCEQVSNRLTELQAENAKLRELAVLQSVIFKHMSTCPTTDCQICPVEEECAESVHLEGLLGIDDKETSWLVQWRSEDAADVRAENAKLRTQRADVTESVGRMEERCAKLRELAWDMHECLEDECKRCHEWGDICDLEHEMRELGVMGW